VNASFHINLDLQKERERYTSVPKLYGKKEFNESLIRLRERLKAPLSTSLVNPNQNKKKKKKKKNLNIYNFIEVI